MGINQEVQADHLIDSIHEKDIYNILSNIFIVHKIVQTSVGTQISKDNESDSMDPSDRKRIYIEYIVDTGDTTPIDSIHHDTSIKPLLDSIESLVKLDHKSIERIQEYFMKQSIESFGNLSELIYSKRILSELASQGKEIDQEILLNLKGQVDTAFTAMIASEFLQRVLNLKNSSEEPDEKSKMQAELIFDIAEFSEMGLTLAKQYNDWLEILQVRNRFDAQTIAGGNLITASIVIGSIILGYMEYTESISLAQKIPAEINNFLWGMALSLSFLSSATPWINDLLHLTNNSKNPSIISRNNNSENLYQEFIAKFANPFQEVETEELGKYLDILRANFAEITARNELDYHKQIEKFFEEFRSLLVTAGSYDQSLDMGSQMKQRRLTITFSLLAVFLLHFASYASTS